MNIQIYFVVKLVKTSIQHFEVIVEKQLERILIDKIKIQKISMKKTAQRILLKYFLKLKGCILLHVKDF